MAYQVPSITVETLLVHNGPIIDVRTPKEFAEFHIPGAVNVPIFSNEERAQVGTLYTQKGPEAAKDRGIAFVAEKLPELYQTIKQQDAEQSGEMVIHCWRGGMRSRSVVSLMQSLDISCKQLEGGIRSFRKRIMHDLESFAETVPPFIVLEGLTGTRKTDILIELQKEGYPVLDLEGMAGHRGSAFGAIGLEQSSQKSFECKLWQWLWQLQDAPYMIIEGESKRIGRVVLPDFILERKHAGQRIHLTYPFQKRIESLCRDYQPEKHHEEICASVSRIEKHVATEAKNDLHHALSQKDYRRVVSILLEYYYDPRYQHSHGQYETSVIQVNMEGFTGGLNEVRQAIGHMH